MNKVLLRIALLSIFATLLVSSLVYATVSKRSTNEMLSEKVKAFIISDSPWEDWQVHVKILSGNSPDLSNFEGDFGDISYQGVPLSHSGRKTFNFWLHTKSVTRRYYVTTEIEIMEKVVVTSKPLKRSHILTKSDVFVAERKITTGESLYSLNNVIGKRLKRYVKANSVLREDYLDLPILIDKNDKITILLKRGNLKITTVGIAKEDGKQGKIIRVMNLDSRKTVYGEVMDSQTVVVSF